MAKRNVDLITEAFGEVMSNRRKYELKKANGELLKELYFPPLTRHDRIQAQAAAGTGNVHIYRETDVNTAAAVFAAGSSIRAADLNAIHDMGRFAAVEHRNKIIKVTTIISIIIITIIIL